MLEEDSVKEHPGIAFKKLCEKAKSMGINPKDLANLDAAKALKHKPQPKKKYLRISCSCFIMMEMVFFVTLGVVLVAALTWTTEWPMTRRRVAELVFDYVLDEDIDRASCALELPEEVVDLTRPPVDCTVCENIYSVDRVEGISPEAFEEKYAYSGVPVVITDATDRWTATDTFSFNFFKGIYADDSPALQNSAENCQFFPYKTDFNSLREVFNMSQERADLKEGSQPWYIGWSNCDSRAANILRQHYERPYFLPRVSEGSKTDWIFMGSPGYGAHMHIDHVGNPSWQAQITGTKEWTLEPPAECFHLCPNQVKVLVKPGEVIVLDTNMWYHGTKIIGDDLSIVIGSEYD